jgi:hypothetical protein
VPQRDYVWDAMLTVVIPVIVLVTFLVLLTFVMCVKFEPSWFGGRSDK